MNRHREFLQILFRILEEGRVPYCIQRNYEDLYAQGNLDIDLVCEPEALSSFNDSVRQAADASAYRLVLRTRYINQSQVFRHPEAGFIRLDVETEIRWRVFPLLSAKGIIGLRRRRDDFYVPHPRHESVILFAAAIWRGILSERYRRQLACLYDELKDPDQLRRTFRAVFGRAGDALADCQAMIATEPPSPHLLKESRRSIIANALRHRPNRRAVLAYLLTDARRLAQRLRRPPGISLLHLSSAQPPSNIEQLLKPLDFLFSAEKSVLSASDAILHANPYFRPGLRLRLNRLYTMFKGGLFIDYRHVADDIELSRALARQTDGSYPYRAFVSLENSRCELTLAHFGTGFMKETEPFKDIAARSDRLVQFIATILGRAGLPEGAQGCSYTRGSFIVLLGLDGSGKTTVARHLSHLAAQSERFRAVRYFHWRPSLGISLPLANPVFVPRKPKLQPTPLRSFLSILRLLKNIILTRVAWSVRVRKLLRRQALIIIDRYYYNYFLDPVSVRYYGSPRLLERMQRFYPRPDLVVVLAAPAATLLARKQELSPEEIHRQSSVLDQLALDAQDKLVVDATQSPQEIAQEIWRKITCPDGPVIAPSVNAADHG